MDKEVFFSDFAQHPVIAILRSVERSCLLPLAQALYEGGIRYAEIPFCPTDNEDDSETAASISLLADAMEGKMHIGAGTVVSEWQLESAASCGAQFIVSPNTDTGIIKRTVEMGLVSVPGAMTPTEILKAHDAGADLVKIFPYNVLGPGYFQSMAAPLGHIPMLAVGGVCGENFRQALEAGAVGVGVGAYLSDPAVLAKGDYAEIMRRAREFVL